MLKLTSATAETATRANRLFITALPIEIGVVLRRVQDLGMSPQDAAPNANHQRRAPLARPLDGFVSHLS
jgi:hypothetical protein